MLVALDDQDQLARLVFPNGHDQWAHEIARKRCTIIPDSPRCDSVVEQLTEYFAGQRRAFDMPLHMIGTAFQQTVWTALLTIPYGTIINYRQLAERIGNPAAIRAVGRANATNPIPIVVPCHRVIGADGSLTGFGGGLPLKEALLKLEGVDVQDKRIEQQPMLPGLNP
ncbi:MAG: methylated-DNA--[protein]-cysteine S-methyltransferase [Anaerolineae bacterium]|nr:methylated-DNA--[protein]-cysteine S-methyltransferase [Anaerolineae bacterium]